jgi:hypothetical protein
MSPYVDVLAEKTVSVCTLTSIVFNVIYDFFNIYFAIFTAAVYKRVGIL